MKFVTPFVVFALVGLSVAPLEASASSWEFDSGLDGFTTNACSSATTANSRATLQVSCSGGQFARAGLSLDAADASVLVVDTTSLFTGRLAVEFTSGGETHRLPQSARLEHDGDLHRYRFWLNGHPAWAGTIDSVALVVEANTGKLEIERVALTASPWRGMWSFDEAGNREGWTASSTITGLAATGGALSGTVAVTSSTKPRVESRSPLRLSARDYRTLYVTVAATVPGGESTARSLQLWWGTDTAPTLNVSRSMTADYTADGSPQTLRFDVFTHAKWESRIDLLWLQPFVTAPDGATFQILDVGFGPRADFEMASPTTGFVGDGADVLRIGDGALRGTIADGPVSLTTPFRGSAAPWAAVVVEATLDPGPSCTLEVTLTDENGPHQLIPAPACDGSRERFVLDLDGSIGDLESITLGLPGGAGRRFAIHRLELMASGPSFELESVDAVRPTTVGETLPITATVSNRGLATAVGGKLIVSGGSIVFLPPLEPFATTSADWTLATPNNCATGNAQSVIVTANFPHPVSGPAWTQGLQADPWWLTPLGPVPPQVPPSGSGPSGAVAGDAAFIQNDRIRATLHQDSCLGGFGYLRLYIPRDGAWEAVGGRLGLGRLVHRLLSGAVEDVTFTDASVGTIISGDDTLTLPLTATHVDGDGVTWQLAWSLTVRLGSATVEVTASATPNGKRDVLRFDGPGIDPGLGVDTTPTFGAAWMSGVMRLLPGEHPNDSAAIVTEDHLRSTPSVEMVLQPIMGIEMNDLVVGMRWDPGQTWSPGTPRPLPQLLPPGTDETTASLRLLAPNTPEFVAPGNELASEPLTLFASSSVSITGSLFAHLGGGAEGLITAVRESYGIPSGAIVVDPVMRERVRAGLTDAWTGSAWVLNEDGQTSLAGDIAASARALTLLEEAPALTTVVDSAAAALSPAALMDGPDWVGMDGPWYYGHLLDAIAAKWTALQAIDAAGPAASAPTELLAPEHADEYGVAELAWALLRFGRLTGIEAATQAGLARLQSLVDVYWPLGGLVHDGIPSAAPDVASCINALMACVEGWHTTGDDFWRDRAAHFGYEALLFVSPSPIASVGNLGTYATLPALGARYYTESVFATSSATQALRLGLALGELAIIRPGEGWDSTADGLVNHVLSQLTDTDAEPPGHHVAGLDLRSGDALGGYQLPYLAARALAERAGYTLRTIALASPAEEDIIVTGVLSMTAMAFDTSSYAVQVALPDLPADQVTWLTVGNLAGAPPTIWVGDDELSQSDDLASAATGWDFDPNTGVAALKLAPGLEAPVVRVGFPIPDKDGDSFPANLDCDDDNKFIFPGQDEVCNNVDDDCDSDTDEAEALGYNECGIGACAHSEPKCVAGELVACNPELGKTDEICNDIDDDCDGETDEEVGFVDCGVGICKRTIYACDECDPFLGKEPEVCDSVDNDCDGETDETEGTVLCGLGACEHIISVCDPCDAFTGASEEICNLIDDDCDGETDEGLPTVSCGQGACLHDIPQCAPCDAFKGAIDEVCNFIDDDCDGDTDEDTVTKTCGTGKCERQIPECHECDPLVGKVPEICNGIDDDCNGITDDAEGNKPCGTGQCYREIGKCETCDPNEGAYAEVCDGADNDCDGETDELTGAAICGLGECAHEVIGCEACDALLGAVDEICDGLDNDCDGETDEVEDLGTFECGLGECFRVLENCTDGAATECNELLGATEEVCDGLDNDCNGETDDGIVTWVCGVGQCEQILEGCVLKGPGSCDPFAGATDEVCDGIDNDCDGETDEELGTVTCGESLGCPQELPACVGGDPLECHPITGLAPEICDGVDNDCDDITDEDLPSVVCGTGVCLHSEPSCVDGLPHECDPLAGAQEETCNFVDDDCDGETDESSPPITCGEGICQVTVSGCNNGLPMSCTPLDVAKPDVCNGLDDDCDGQTDENQGEITCGIGACKQVLPLCKDGETQTCPPDMGGSEEVCNGIDDDCDGTTDEDLGTQECGQGACFRVLASCTDGSPTVCDPFVGVKAETCNNIDDDCDGQTDEGQGCDGADATDGTDGTTGTSGSTGTDGTSGANGNDGTTGTNGSVADGVVGDAGSTIGGAAPAPEGCQAQPGTPGPAPLLPLLLALAVLWLTRRRVG